MAQDSPSRKLDQYIVRFPDGMRDRLKLEASINKRSLNAEIVARLSESLNSDVPPSFATDEIRRARARGEEPSISIEDVVANTFRRNFKVFMDRALRQTLHSLKTAGVTLDVSNARAKTLLERYAPEPDGSVDPDVPNSSAPIPNVLPPRSFKRDDEK